MYKRVTVLERTLCLIVSTFPIFMFVDQLLFVEVFSQLYYLTAAKKQLCRTYRYKSLRSWISDNIDLTQQFDVSIFTDFRYQSIKITWLLSIFIDKLLRVSKNDTLQWTRKDAKKRQYDRKWQKIWSLRHGCHKREWSRLQMANRSGYELLISRSAVLSN